MASMKCHQCGTVAKCKLVVEVVEGKRIYSYICAKCAKELGR